MTEQNQIAYSHHSDLRAEAYMVESDYNGLLDDKTLIYSNGGFKRAYRNDIQKTHPEDQNAFKLDREITELNRTGIYDGFPELLFHKSKKSKQFKSTKDLREDHLYNNEIEENTRKFFWPLDHYLVKMKCHIYAHETGKNPVDKMGASKNLQRFWGIPSFFKKHQVATLCNVMPYAKEIAMNLPWAEQTFRLVLGVEVAINKELKMADYPFKNGGRILGNAFLGNNSTIGACLKIAKYAILIEIGPLSKKAAPGYGNNERDQRALDYLIETFLPLDFIIEKKILPEPGMSMKLDTDIREKSILGLTSTL